MGELTVVTFSTKWDDPPAPRRSWHISASESTPHPPLSAPDPEPGVGGQLLLGS